MPSIPRLRIDETRPRLLITASWHVLVVFVLLLVPTQLALHRAFWLLEPREVPQVLVVAGAYVFFVLLLRLAASRPSGLGIPAAVLLGVACFGAATLLVWLRRDLTHSRALLLVGNALGMTLALLPFVLGQARLGALSALAAGSLALIALVSIRDQPRENTSIRRIFGALYNFDVHYFHDLVSRPLGTLGGAIVPYEAGYLLVTGEGDFYHLTWNAKGDSLQSRPLKLDVPIGRAQSVADHKNPAFAPRLRVTDLILDSLSNPVRVIVGYQHWNHDGQCISLNVSATNLDSAALNGSTTGQWHTLFESKPCMEHSFRFDDVETGGRLAWARDRRLFFTTGDLGFDSLAGPPVSQRMDNDYGKVLLLDGKGGREIYSIGHRNPQGLTMSRAGRLWETEHGPQGGDEINLIVKGANYGWPLVTYGTQYGLNYWPVSPDARDHGGFAEPAYVFVPSVAVSNLIEVGPKEFPKWEGDLLVASLRAQQLLRVRTRGDNVVYARATQLDRRFRDIAQGADGRIALWTDEGDVLVLSSAPWERSGGDVYAGSCGHCHDPLGGRDVSTAPTIHGVIGRTVASMPKFEYSSGLRAAGGQWTKERLNTFLREPAAFAPGTPMLAWAVPDSVERRKLIEYIAQLK